MPDVTASPAVDSPRRSRRFAFVFNCSGGEPEIKAMLLAASIRRFARCDHEIVVGVPGPPDVFAPPSPAAIAMFESIGARIESITNDVDLSYPYANKLNCLAVPTDADKRIFLDYDILALREIHDDPIFDVPMLVKVADRATFSKDEDMWRRVYVAVGTTLPDERVRTTVTDESVPPYFNAGFIAVDADIDFASAWNECCRIIDADEAIDNKRPWLDQVGLAAAIRKLDLRYECLDEKYNFPGHYRPVPRGERPIFYHYHRPDRIAAQPPLKTLVRSLAAEHDAIRAAILAHPAWKPILTREPLKVLTGRVRRHPLTKRATKVAATIAGPLLDRRHALTTPPEEKRRNVLITGVPRSGTSLFISLLNRVDGIVALNEIYASPHLHRVFHRLRRMIEQGRSVPNKFDAQGQVTTNTIDGDTHVRRTRIEVDRPNFVLAHKLTLPYLRRLPELARAGWEVWALVRHPAYAIASWMRCPPNFPVADLATPHPLLDHVPFTTTDLPTRRIEAWNHLARTIHAHRDRINVVRYEDLVADAASELGRFCKRYDLVVPDLEQLETNNRSRRYAGLDEEFLTRVEAECELDLFGYEPVGRRRIANKLGCETERRGFSTIRGDHVGARFCHQDDGGYETDRRHLRPDYS